MINKGWEKTRKKTEVIEEEKHKLGKRGCQRKAKMRDGTQGAEGWEGCL